MGFVHIESPADVQRPSSQPHKQATDAENCLSVCCTHETREVALRVDHKTMAIDPSTVRP